MLKAIKRALANAGEVNADSGFERRQLHVAVAVLLHEARRADYQEGSDESALAERALIELFGLDQAAAAEIMRQGRTRAQELASFYAPISTIKRDFSAEKRVQLIEHLWRISFADGQLNLYEDHYVRKIAHLLYVPNTQSMLARNRARG
jgi:uncharacterized tellurite resistance protein B-like protein